MPAAVFGSPIRRVLNCVSALLICSSAAAGQPVTLAPRFTVGETARYTIEAEFTRRRAPQDDAPGTRVAQSAEITLKTVAAEPDGGAVVRVRFERLRTSIQTLGPAPVTRGWEWKRGADEPVEEGPLIDGLDAASSALVESPIRVTIGADGTLRSMEGIEAAYDALRERDAADATPILGVFSPGASVSFFEAFWSFGSTRVGPRRVSPGEAWRVAKSAPLFGGYEAEAVTEYTLERVAGDVAHIAGRTRFELVPPDLGRDPAAPLPAIQEQSGRVEATWDTAARRLIRRKVERTFAWSATLSLAEPIEIRDYTSSRVEIAFVAPRAP